MATGKMPLNDDDTFEGEETLGAEEREIKERAGAIVLPAQESIYPDAIVNIVPESASVFQLKRKSEKNPPLIKLDPDFQRNAVWNQKQKSELIESILMGIPLPLIYVKEDDKGVYIIVDGRQRLATMFQFLNHEFCLQDLRVLTDLNGSFFSNESRNGTKFEKYLTQVQQSKIEDCPLTLHVIKPPTQDRVTFDLFDRVNRGGTRLNNQEMRNAIYQGAATKLLNELARLESFKIATEYSIKSDRMKDKYLILRLVAFYLWKKKRLLSVKDKGAPLVEYRSDLEDFLGKTMIFLNDPAGDTFCSEFPELFDQAMLRCNSLLGTGCFRLPRKTEDGPRRPIHMALFETVGYLILETMYVDQDKYSTVQSVYESLLADTRPEGFIRFITYTIDSNIGVNGRFNLVEAKIKEILNA